MSLFCPIVQGEAYHVNHFKLLPLVAFSELHESSFEALFHKFLCSYRSGFRATVNSATSLSPCSYLNIKSFALFKPGGVVSAT